MNLQKEVEALYRVDLMGNAQAALESWYEGKEDAPPQERGCELEPGAPLNLAVEQACQAQRLMNQVGFSLCMSHGLVAGLTHHPLQEDVQGRPFVEESFLQEREVYSRKMEARDACLAAAREKVDAKAYAEVKSRVAALQESMAYDRPRALYMGYWLGDYFWRQYTTRSEPQAECLARWTGPLGIEAKDGAGTLPGRLKKIYRVDLMDAARVIVENLYQEEAAEGRRPWDWDYLEHWAGAGPNGINPHPAVVQVRRARANIEAMGCRMYFCQGFFTAVGNLVVRRDADGAPLADEESLQRYRAYQAARRALKRGMEAARPGMNKREYVQLEKDVEFLKQMAEYNWPRMFYLGFCFGDYFLCQYEPSYLTQTLQMARWARALKIEKTTSP